jgi:hypothetical protein
MLTIARADNVANWVMSCCAERDDEAEFARTDWATFTVRASGGRTFSIRVEEVEA